MQGVEVFILFWWHSRDHHQAQQTVRVMSAIISWEAVQNFCSYRPENRLNFQAVLHSDGILDIRWGSGNPHAVVAALPQALVITILVLLYFLLVIWLLQESPLGQMAQPLQENGPLTNVAGLSQLLTVHIARMLFKATKDVLVMKTSSLPLSPTT